MLIFILIYSLLFFTMIYVLLYLMLFSMVYHICCINAISFPLDILEWGIETYIGGRVCGYVIFQHGEGVWLDELPPSSGWPCLVENKLFSKPIEAPLEF